MKTLLSLFVSATVASSAHAASAYEALRTVGKERGEALLDHVVELRGSKGAPDPVSWKVTVADDTARGGVREFEVRGTKIVGERTPIDGATGKSLNLNQLNLDSDGAHTVAERESKKTAFAYDYVDYALRAGTGAGTPMWELRLADDRAGNVATVSIAADSGKMVESGGLQGGRKGRVAENDPSERKTRPSDSAEPRETPKERPKRESEGGGEKLGARVNRFAERAGRHIGGAFQKFGDRVNRVFTGEPRESTPRSNPAPPSNYRDRNGTEFYRPKD